MSAPYAVLLLAVVLGSTAAVAAVPAQAPAPVPTGAVAAGWLAVVSGAGSTVLEPPLSEAVVVAPFRAPPEPWSRGHRGVDLQAPAGTPVLAPGAGTVTFAGTVVDRAVLTLSHPGGLRSSLEPVLGEVAVGAHVSPGQRVGTVQGVPTHCAPRHCLHWGVRRDRTYLDPLSLLAGAGPVVLLPEP